MKLIIDLLILVLLLIIAIEGYNIAQDLREFLDDDEEVPF